MTKRRSALRRALLLMLTAAALTADSRWHLQLTEYELSFASLPPALDGYRIVVLSDLHGARFGADNRCLARAVLAQQPDLIALTGDFADDHHQLSATAALLRQLQGVSPIAWVSGNHDWAGGALPALRRLLDQYGVDYVYISSYERMAFEVDEAWFVDNCDTVFAEGNVCLYRRRGVHWKSTET